MTHLVSIGNSQGIRIPKILIEQTGLQDKELNLIVTSEGLLVSPNNELRYGWDEAFKQSADTDTDPTVTYLANDFDADEWQW